MVVLGSGFLLILSLIIPITCCLHSFLFNSIVIFLEASLVLSEEKEMVLA
jgi:hypothetical protein